MSEHVEVVLEETPMEEYTREELLSLLRQKQNVEKNYEIALDQTRKMVEEIRKETDEALEKLKERNEHMATYIRNREAEFTDFKQTMNLLIKGLDKMTSTGGVQ